MFKVIVGMEEIGEFVNFKEAFIAFYNESHKQVGKGISWQVLETANWIEFHVQTAKSRHEYTMDFYQARDFAYQVGLMKDGKLQEISREIHPLLVAKSFVNAHIESCARECEEFIEMIQSFGSPSVRIK